MASRLTLLWKHENSCRYADISNECVVAPTNEGEIQVFEVLTGTLLGRFAVSSESFTYHRVAGLAAYFDGRIRLIGKDGSTVAERPFDHIDESSGVLVWPRLGMRFTAAGNLLWVADGHAAKPCLRLLDTATLDEVDCFLYPDDSLCDVRLLADPLRPRLAVADVAGDSFLSLSTYEIRDGKISQLSYCDSESEVAAAPIELCRFSPDGAKLNGRDYCDIVREWSWPDCQILTEWAFPGEENEGYQPAVCGYLDEDTMLVGCIDFDDKFQFVVLVRDEALLCKVDLPQPSEFLEFGCDGIIALSSPKTGISVYQLLLE